MRNIFTFVMFIFANFLFSQKIEQFNYDYKFDYEFSLKTDSLKENYGKALMTLYSNQKESIFQDSHKNKMDSVLFGPNRPAIIDLSINSGKKIDFVIRKKRDENTLIYSELVYIDNLGFTENLNLFDWEILNERKNIAGYECTKATTKFRGRHYIAWFTHEIPMTDGPYKFNGLPGLILELQDSKKNFHFVTKRIKKESGIIYYNTSIIGTERKKIIPAKLNYYNSMMTGKRQEIVYNPIELE